MSWYSFVPKLLYICISSPNCPLLSFYRKNCTSITLAPGQWPKSNVMIICCISSPNCPFLSKILIQL
jgi:hypothetical protein